MDVSERLSQNTIVNAKTTFRLITFILCILSYHLSHSLETMNMTISHNISFHSSKYGFCIDYCFFTTFSRYINRALYNLT